MDPDEKLLYDGFQSGTNALATILQNELAAREAEEEAERKRDEEREREKAAAAQKLRLETRREVKRARAGVPPLKRRRMMLHQHPLLLLQKR